MSKKRTRDVSNNTTEVDTLHVNNKYSLQKYEQTKLQNITPVCILFNILIKIIDCFIHSYFKNKATWPMPSCLNVCCRINHYNDREIIPKTSYQTYMIDWMFLEYIIKAQGLAFWP